MTEPLSLTVIGRLKDRPHAFVANSRKRPKGYHYPAIHHEVSEAQRTLSQNGAAHESDTAAALSWASASMPGKYECARCFRPCVRQS
jgi:hypothetical protein